LQAALGTIPYQKLNECGIDYLAVCAGFAMPPQKSDNARWRALCGSVESKTNRSA
jgi:hypothetical protein